jgi:threonylcarbamoyladenosine tRNA methylthiotransferase MtaB
MSNTGDLEQSMKFFIHTTGCKANQWDGFAIAAKLKQAGCSEAPQADSDLVLINACTLTDGAERDTRRFIARTRRINKAAKIVLAGCHGQVYPETSFGCELVLGHGEKFHIDQYLNMAGRHVGEADGSLLEPVPRVGYFPGRTRVFFKIQDGCDRFCSYCVVPFARGTPRSRGVDEIVETLGRFAEMGVKEVVLTGIEIASYCDASSGRGLASLLKLLEERETPPRIRIRSLDPSFIDDGFIDLLGASAKIMPHLHLPVQSGSGMLLDRMKRPYGPKEISGRVAKLNERVKDIAIGMDIIAGFPGEDGGAFEETLRFIEDIPVSYLHVFPFSARKGTAASSMDGSVPQQEKKKRVTRLKEVDALKRMAYYSRFLGRTMWVLPEGKVYGGAYLRGYTPNYIPVYVMRAKGLENTLSQVTIQEIREGRPVGVVVQGR